MMCYLWISAVVSAKSKRVFGLPTAVSGFTAVRDYYFFIFGIFQGGTEELGCIWVVSGGSLGGAVFDQPGI